MQESKEWTLNVTPVNGVVPLNPVMSRGLFAPYHQQRHDINQMLQNQMTIELHKQLRSLEERAVLCLKIKDKALEETKKKCAETETRLINALAEADYLRNMMNQKTNLCSDLAGRLLEMRRREDLMRRSGQYMNFAEEAHSSTGENGEDVVDTARTHRGKRRRL